MTFWSDERARIPDWKRLLPPDVAADACGGVAFALDEDPIGKRLNVVYNFNEDWARLWTQSP
jgi:hypothetical protein